MIIEPVIGIVDLDGVMANFDKAAKGDPLNRHNPGFFLGLEPIEDAIWAFEELTKYFEMHFVSTAPWKNVHSSSEKRIWVEQHIGKIAFKRLTLTHNKHLFKGSFIIDDRTANGVDRFEGEHIHIFTDPRFMSWKAVVEYLVNKYAEGIPSLIPTYHEED